jgi:hypothetical protein
MATATTTRAPRREATTTARREHETARDPGRLAFSLLRTGFTVAPIAFGVDKFFDKMVKWDHYLWKGFADLFNVTPHQFMLGVGVVEIIAGLCVLLAPQIGGGLVAVWLGGIITNLVIVGVKEGEYWDIALRDFGLMIGAVSLVLLATKYAPIIGRRSPLDIRDQ